MKAKAKNYVWVIELLSEKGVWESCSACGISKYEGKEKLTAWRRDLQDDKLRLRKYVAA